MKKNKSKVKKNERKREAQIKKNVEKSPIILDDKNAIPFLFNYQKENPENEVRIVMRIIHVTAAITSVCRYLTIMIHCLQCTTNATTSLLSKHGIFDTCISGNPLS